MCSMRPSARTKCCRGSGRAAPGTCGSAGRWPATSTATATAEATATAKAGLLWDGGVGPVAGDAVNPQTGPAAGGCAFGRLRSSASQSKRPHPWRLGRAIHGAHAPATGPTPPSTIPRCCWWVSTLVDTVDPRHAWMLFDHLINCRNIRSRWRFIHAWRGSTRHRGIVEGGAVSDCGVSAAWMPRPSLQGRTCGVPAIRHRPAIPRNARCCRCC